MEFETNSPVSTAALCYYALSYTINSQITRLCHFRSVLFQFCVYAASDSASVGSVSLVDAQLPGLPLCL